MVEMLNQVVAALNRGWVIPLFWAAHISVGWWCVKQQGKV